MMTRYIKYFKPVSQYLGASMIPMLINLAINPLVAMNMSPDDYAVTGYYSSFSAFFSPLVTFYMLHYYTKRYYELDESGRANLRSMLVKSLIFFPILVSLLCLMGLYVYITCFNRESGIPFSPYAFLAVSVLPVSGLYGLMLTDLKMGRQSGGYFKVSVFVSVFISLLTLLFVVLLKWGAFGKLLAPLAVNLVLFFYTSHYYRDSFNVPFDWKQFKEMLVFCCPLTIAAVLGFFSNGYDRVLLERLGNNTELGYYSVGVQMASYITVFQNAIGNTLQPDLFQAISVRNKRKIISVICLSIGSTAFIVAVFIVAAPLVVRILTAGCYMMSVKYTQIIALSTFSSALYFTVSQITVALGRSKLILATKVIVTILSIIMFSLLIPRYEYIGAAWGVVLSYAVSFLVSVVLLFLASKCTKGKCL